MADVIDASPKGKKNPANHIILAGNGEIRESQLSQFCRESTEMLSIT